MAPVARFEIVPRNATDGSVTRRHRAADGLVVGCTLTAQSLISRTRSQPFAYGLNQQACRLEGRASAPRRRRTFSLRDILTNGSSGAHLHLRLKGPRWARRMPTLRQLSRVCVICIAQTESCRRGFALQQCRVVMRNLALRSRSWQFGHFCCDAIDRPGGWLLR